MKQNNLSFESENLVVDYISFKFQESHCDQNKIAKYLIFSILDLTLTNNQANYQNQFKKECWLILKINLQFYLSTIILIGKELCFNFQA